MATIPELNSTIVRKEKWNPGEYEAWAAKSEGEKLAYSGFGQSVLEQLGFDREKDARLFAEVGSWKNEDALAKVGHYYGQKTQSPFSLAQLRNAADNRDWIDGHGYLQDRTLETYGMQRNEKYKEDNQEWKLENVRDEYAKSEENIKKLEANELAVREGARALMNKNRNLQKKTNSLAISPDV